MHSLECGSSESWMAIAKSCPYSAPTINISAIPAQLLYRTINRTLHVRTPQNRHRLYEDAVIDCDLALRKHNRDRRGSACLGPKDWNNEGPPLELVILNATAWLRQGARYHKLGHLYSQFPCSVSCVRISIHLLIM